ncbi:MAG: hypothetical protein CVU22_06305 [Betaproteobacteria bacterium HGW-Betaproteobacteria-16]|nr:MAG: hypothetical protein CVU22_06305 [Betaproteobacteria bacterium HGW-Betaproteobacteria-16]
MATANLPAVVVGAGATVVELHPEAVPVILIPLLTRIPILTQVHQTLAVQAHRIKGLAHLLPPLVLHLLHRSRSPRSQTVLVQPVQAGSTGSASRIQNHLGQLDLALQVL